MIGEIVGRINRAAAGPDQWNPRCFGKFRRNRPAME
jgi:hypothetical protein